MELQVLTTKNFNGVDFNCYRADGQDNGDFWATREQIGQLLEYENPNIAIGIIHQRNADRLNKFSTLIKMNKVEGTRTITRDVIVYNFRGLLEICRYSNQPKADAVMDFLYDIADEIRRTGYYGLSGKKQEEEQKPKLDYLSRSRERTAFKIFDAVFNTTGAELSESDVKKVLALDKIFKSSTGLSLLELTGVKLEAITTWTTKKITFYDDEPIYCPEQKTEYRWKDNLLKEYFDKKE
ncbi:MAG: hypothetical protein IJQ99_03165 [Synergistaceae bacterium]|nr:hypothetical protein [Synergistaceae bacterium]